MAASDSDEEPPATDAVVHWSVIKNMDNVERDFADYVSDPVKGLMVRVVDGRRLYLHASRLGNYSYLSSAFYHPGQAVHDTSAQALLEKLGRFGSWFGRERYEGVARIVRGAYWNCFVRTIKSEATLASNFGDFVSAVVSAVDTEGLTYVLKNCECYAAASGFLCKRKISGRNDLIDENAGYMGKTDCVLFYGEKEEILCAIEYKFLQTPNVVEGHRWFTVSGALLPQTLQSWVGHGAPLALAFTEQGFKVFYSERHSDDVVTLHSWPPGEGFHFPRVPEEDDEGLNILIDIVRIATRPYEYSANALTRPCTRANEADDFGPRSPTRKPQSGPKSAKPRGDKTMQIKKVDGAIMKVTSICLESRFTPEELLEISQFDREVHENTD